MKAKKQKIIFVCQTNDQFLKVGKYSVEPGQKSKILGFEKNLIPSGADTKILKDAINSLLKKLEYSNNNIVVCLPRWQATCRYIKIPSITESEVEKIAYLQCALYLPYPPEELICGYQLIRIKDGYSEINLTIAHKNSVDKYTDIFAQQIKSEKLNVVLSSYGLCGLFYSLKPDENECVMLVDEGDGQAEIAVVLMNKVLYSRSFKLLKSQEGWQDTLKTEIAKTKDAFSKEMPGITVNRVETLAHPEASMLGLARENIPVSLNLLPKELKEKSAVSTLKKERIKIAIFAAGITLIWIIGALKNLDNKTKYLIRLKSELRQISNEAKPLENIEQRFKFLEKNTAKKESGLEVLYELHKIIPIKVNLTSLDYEDNKTLLLRGLTSELNSVFSLVSELEKSPVFNKFKIKIDYATQKKLVSGEMVDFQISCQK